MVRIIDTGDSGKTKKLLKEAYDNRGVVVCKYPAHMADKAEAYGYLGLEFISYTEFFTMERDGSKKYYIDEIEELFNLISPNIAGYTITIDK